MALSATRMSGPFGVLESTPAECDTATILSSHVYQKHVLFMKVS